MADGETRTIRITAYEEGEALISPKYEGAPATKRVPCMRLHLAPGIKPTVPYYWDITSTTLIAGLRSLLRLPDYTEKTITIKKFGIAPKARFSLEWV